MNCRDGHPNPDGAIFCNACGQPLRDAAPSGAAGSPAGAAAPRSTRRAAVVAAGVVVVGAVVAAGLLVTRGDAITRPDQGDKADTFTVTGTLALTDEDMRNPSFDRLVNRCDFDEACSQAAGEPCAAGGAGYGDIAAGAQVRVTDDDGTVIAIGSLGDGETPFTPDVWETAADYPPCLFPFTIDDVPDAGTLYGVEVTHRGVIQFTMDEAGSLSFSLGD